MNFTRTIHTLLTLLVVSVSVKTSTAQSVTPVPIALPISGQLVKPFDQINEPLGATFSLLDTQTGDWRVLLPYQESFLAIGFPTFSSDGQQLAIFLNQNASTIVDVNTGEMEITPQLPSRNDVYFPMGWASDNKQLLIKTQDTPRYRMEILDLETNTATNIFDFLDEDPIPANWPIPLGITSVAFVRFDQATWNPVYPEWIAFTAVLSGENVPNGNRGFFVTLLYNYVTGQFLSIDQLIESDGGVMTDWSSDGQYLAFNTGYGATIVRFSLDDGEARLELVDSVPNTQYQVILHWLGVEDLLITVLKVDDDIVYYIAQIIDGTWYSTEFLRFPADTFRVGNDTDWILTADEEEQRELSCLFDQALVPRLAVNGRGRVNFTDGTPSRLRAAPGTDESVITQMPEGTEFTITKEPWCANGYRWWEIQLDDNTVGYAAEADAGDYSLEPIN